MVLYCRFGHSLVSDVFNLSNATVKLEKNFDNFNATFVPGQFPSDFLESLSTSDSEIQDHILVEALTNYLFARSPFLFGTDLYSLNIQVNKELF